VVVEVGETETEPELGETEPAVGEIETEVAPETLQEREAD